MSEVATEMKKAEEAIIAPFKAIEGEVVGEAKEVVKVAEKVIQTLTAEEQLAFRNIENEFLKAQAEINRLTQTTQAKQHEFSNYSTALLRKYLLEPTEWVFDTVALRFQRKSK